MSPDPASRPRMSEETSIFLSVNVAECQEASTELFVHPVFHKRSVLSLRLVRDACAWPHFDAQLSRSGAPSYRLCLNNCLARSGSLRGSCCPSRHSWRTVETCSKPQPGHLSAVFCSFCQKGASAFAAAWRIVLACTLML